MSITNGRKMRNICNKDKMCQWRFINFRLLTLFLLM